ncbi:MAG: hypothetical protein WCA26_21055 [Xanthobacteraceae bacterium]
MSIGFNLRSLEIYPGTKKGRSFFVTGLPERTAGELDEYSEVGLGGVPSRPMAVSFPTRLRHAMIVNGVPAAGRAE